MISPLLSNVYRTSTGNKFHGIFSDPEDRFEGDEMRAPRILRTNADAPVGPGSIIKAHNIEYILFQHTHGPGQKRFLAFEITDYVEWSREVEQIDPVTRMMGNSYSKILDASFPIYLQPDNTIRDIGMSRTAYLIRCSAGVEVGDKLGPYTVQTLQKVQGASIIEAY